MKELWFKNLESLRSKYLKTVKPRDTSFFLPARFILPSSESRVCSDLSFLSVMSSSRIPACSHG